MFDDLHQEYVEWSKASGSTSVLEFSDYVFAKTGVMLSQIWTDEERRQLEALYGESVLEGMDSGP